jgi:uncharacterized protein (TIGR02466 family)
MDSIKINSIFPTLYASKVNPDHEKYKQSLIDFCHKYERLNPHKETEVHLNYYSNLLSNNPENLFQYGETKSILDFITQTLKELNEEMKFTSPHRWDITNAWLNINRKYSMHSAHSHGHHVWSGIYYIKTSKNAAPLIFTNSLGEYRQHWPNGVEIKEANDFNAGEIKIFPKEGELIMFPSYLIHHVPQHMDEEERINIAFNVD